MVDPKIPDDRASSFYVSPEGEWEELDMIEVGGAWSTTGDADFDNFIHYAGPIVMCRRAPNTPFPWPVKSGGRCPFCGRTLKEHKREGARMVQKDKDRCRATPLSKFQRAWLRMFSHVAAGGRVTTMPAHHPLAGYYIEITASIEDRVVAAACVARTGLIVDLDDMTYETLRSAGIVE